MLLDTLICFNGTNFFSLNEPPMLFIWTYCDALILRLSGSGRLLGINFGSESWVNVCFCILVFIPLCSYFFLRVEAYVFSLLFNCFEAFVLILEVIGLEEKSWGEMCSRSELVIYCLPVLRRSLLDVLGTMFGP